MYQLLSWESCLVTILIHAGTAAAATATAIINIYLCTLYTSLHDRCFNVQCGLALRSPFSNLIGLLSCLHLLHTLPVNSPTTIMTDARNHEVPKEHHVPTVRVHFSKKGDLADTDAQTGHWMSQDKRHHHKFLNDTVEHVDKNPKPLQPVLEEFGEVIKRDTRLWMLFNTMFEQVSVSLYCAAFIVSFVLLF